MFKHMLIACHLVALSGLVNAAAPAAQSASARVDVNACVTGTRAEGDLYTVELAGGTRVEISRTLDGTPSEIRVLHPNGEAASVTSYEALAARDAEASEANSVDGGAAPGARQGADALAKDKLEPRSKSQRVLSNHLRTITRAYCDRLQKDSAATLKPGKQNEPDPATDWLLWPELREERGFWFREARYQVEETFYSGMDHWSNDMGNWINDLKDKQKDLPACSTVRDDCRSTCDRVGTYAGGVVCGSLAAVASALSAGIGVSVGVYCGGRVLLKIEECRFNCVVPGVPCN